jgi:5-methylcytosine-specific restriction endonuclease McrBC GTP-binding regulatory subunit McrB
LYGVPGAGKSWMIKKEYCTNDKLIERIVFHPDYTYSDFVGQILPRIDEKGKVVYEFSPGPFTKIVRKAFTNPDYMYYLVIEEINRGNAPAIFGDIFQLLDRNKKGASEYEITNADIAKIIYNDENHKVSIPSNMSILCTMNTSDQNVFTLDTAFQRRWNMRLVKNKFTDEPGELAFASTKILDTDVSWEKFFTTINDIILKKNIRMTSSEDKRLGTHFVNESDLQYKKGDERQNSKFAEKVLKYLWDDAFKFNKDELFDLTKVNSLEKVITNFVSSESNDRFLSIFKQNIYDAIVPKVTQ